MQTIFGKAAVLPLIPHKNTHTREKKKSSFSELVKEDEIDKVSRQESTGRNVCATEVVNYKDDHDNHTMK